MPAFADIEFDAEVIEWRGPAPFVFAAIPDSAYGEIRFAARTASYGWGCVPVVAHIGPVGFSTSLIPKDGAFLLPIKLTVQRAAGIVVGDIVHASLIIKSLAPGRDDFGDTTISGTQY